MAFRWFFLQAHYRQQQAFDLDLVRSAGTAMRRVVDRAVAARDAVAGEVSGASGPRTAPLREAFWAAMREDSDAGRTVLFSTHQLEEADAYADRIVLISRGRIIADGSSAEIKSLASGRSLRATVPAGERERVVTELRGLPGVTDVEAYGDRLTVTASDTDDVARRLLTTTAARDLEIRTHSLEEAFIALTGEPERASTITTTEES